MATSTPKARAKRKGSPESASRAKAPDGRKASAPAYLQKKLAVSQPGDPSEQEADALAKEATAGRGAAAAPLAKKIQRLARTAESREADAGPSPQSVAPPAEARIEARKGQGAPLPEPLRLELEEQFGADFSAVRIHIDSEADALCKEHQARAFAVENDLYFATGEYQPETSGGKELLAHELTHVVQQGSGAQRQMARVDTPPATTSPGASGGRTTPGSSTTSAPGAAPVPPTASNTQGDRVSTPDRTITFASLPIPGFKGQAHRGELYRNWSLRRSPRYSADTRPSNQQAVWQNNIGTGTVEGLLQTRAEAAHAQPMQGQYVFRGPARPIVEGSGGHSARGDVNYYFGTLADVAKAMSTPSWNRRGSRSASMEVDHIVECQVSGHPEPTEVNRISNMELLERRPNSQSGNFIDQGVDERVDRVLAAGSATLPLLEGSLPNLRTARTIPAKRALVKTAYTLAFTSFTTDETPRGGTHSSVNENSFWSQANIEAGEHLGPILPAAFSDLGRPGRIAVFPNRSGGVSKSFIWDGSSNAPDRTNNEHTWLKPFVITAKRFFTGDQGNLWLGELDIEIPASDTRYKPMQSTVYVERLPGTNLAGTIQKQAVQRSAERLEKKELSPLTVSDLEIQPEGGLLMQGDVLPSIPLISRARLQYRVDGDDLRIFRVFQGSDFSFPGPISVTQSALTLFYSTREGLGISGRADLAVQNLGTGYVEGGISTGGGFELGGGFDFDSRLFDRAHIEAWYRNERFGARGEIGIDNPNKIKGIRSASITASYEEGVFSATGTVQPSIPGVQEAGLRITHSEAEGLVIGGNLQLTANRAIRSGSVDVTVRKRGEDWKVAATGTAIPAIPGVDSQLTVSYDDGAFLAEFRGAYQRGMLSGNVEVGATNRTLDAEGRPTGAPSEGGDLIVYGSGSATLRVAPWLQATAGVRFAPDGKVTVSGELGLPSSVEVFPRREVQRRLLSVDTQIPIIPGIVAEVGGNVTATAGFGPGTLDQLRVGVTYNPARESETTVTGDARFVIPADAGLRLAARAGIGLGIPGASVTGGLELGGTLGVQGAAEASAHIEWSPARGLSLDAEGYIHAQPKFRFDVSGYVSVSALFIDIYDNRWELAGFEAGSDLRVGVRFPIHYREGQPFSLSADDVTFEVPDVDPGALLDDVGEAIF